MNEEIIDKAHSRGDVFKKAFDDMCKSLDKYGPAEILHLLAVHSRQDPVVHQLLLTYPQVVATGKFLAGLPILKLPRKRGTRRRKRTS